VYLLRGIQLPPLIAKKLEGNHRKFVALSYNHFFSPDTNVYSYANALQIFTCAPYMTEDNCSSTKQQSPHGMEPKGLLSRSQVPQ